MSGHPSELPTCARQSVLTDETGATLKYDAWNRLVDWKKGSTEVKYFYDGLGQKILRQEGSTRTIITNSAANQVLVESDGSAASHKTYVWSPVYVDVFVLRGELTIAPPPTGDYNGDGVVNAADYTVWANHFGMSGIGVPGDGNGDHVVDAADYTVWADHFGQVSIVTRDRRIYARQDANYNVTSLVVGTATTTGGTTTVTWSTAERYAYDPYGVATVMSASFTTLSGTAYGWSQLHQGLSLDAATGLYYNRARWYDATQGRFISADPLGYPDGGSRYEAYGSGPGGRVDASGYKLVPGNLLLTYDWLSPLANLSEEESVTSGPPTSKPTRKPPDIGGAGPVRHEPEVPGSKLADVPDFFEIEGDDEEIRTALGRIFATDAGRQMLRSLNNTRGKGMIKIKKVSKEDHDNLTSSRQKGNTIWVDMDHTFSYMNVGNTLSEFTLERIIAHELGHIIRGEGENQATGEENRIINQINPKAKERRGGHDGYYRDESDHWFMLPTGLKVTVWEYDEKTRCRGAQVW